MLTKPTKIIVIFILLYLGIAGLWAYSWYRMPSYRQLLRAKKRLAMQLLLTDLCLSTESPHVRHVGMPLWIAPFQDLPAYHEHTPASTFFQPILKEKTKIK